MFKKFVIAVGAVSGLTGCTSQQTAQKAVVNNSIVQTRVVKVTEKSQAAKPKSVSPPQNLRDLGQPYQIVEIEDSSVGVVQRKIYRIAVSRRIKEWQVKPTVEQIIAEIVTKDSNLDEIALFIYSDAKSATGPGDVASADWAPNGKWGTTSPEIAQSNDRTNYRITVQVMPKLEQFLTRKYAHETRSGMSDGKRHLIFQECIKAERKATADTDSALPPENVKVLEDIQARAKLSEELHEKYEAQVRRRFGISEKEQSDIKSEGLNKDWSFD